MPEKRGRKRKNKVISPRNTTARFNTEECKILLRAWILAREKGLIFPTSDGEYEVFLKIRRRLEERIEKENLKRRTNGKAEEEYPIEVVEEVQSEAAYN
jgi:hypothetical protein